MHFFKLSKRHQSKNTTMYVLKADHLSSRINQIVMTTMKSTEYEHNLKALLTRANRDIIFNKKKTNYFFKRKQFVCKIYII